MELDKFPENDPLKKHFTCIMFKGNAINIILLSIYTFYVLFCEMLCKLI